MSFYILDLQAVVNRPAFALWPVCFLHKQADDQVACIKCLQNALHSSVRQVELLCLVTASACSNGIDDKKKKTSGKILYDMYYFFLPGFF